MIGSTRRAEQPAWSGSMLSHAALLRASGAYAFPPGVEVHFWSLWVNPGHQKDPNGAAFPIRGPNLTQPEPTEADPLFPGGFPLNINTFEYESRHHSYITSMHTDDW